MSTATTAVILYEDLKFLMHSSNIGGGLFYVLKIWGLLYLSFLKCSFKFLTSQYDAIIVQGHKHIQMLALGGLMWRMLQMHTSKLLKILQQVEDIVWLKELLTIQK